MSMVTKRIAVKASCAVDGDNPWDPSITINLTEDQMDPILGIIHAAVVHSLDDGVKRFREQVIASFSPAIEAEQLEDQTSD
jgi:hypothetical protein